MKLKMFTELMFKDRKEAAKGFGVSYQFYTNWIAQDRSVVQLANGEWMLTCDHNKYFFKGGENV